MNPKKNSKAGEQSGAQVLQGAEGAVVIYPGENEVQGRPYSFSTAT